MCSRQIDVLSYFFCFVGLVDGACVVVDEGWRARFLSGLSQAV